MSLQIEQNGAAIVCDLQGTITRIVHDELGISQRCVNGTSFVEVVDQASIEKAQAFLRTVRENGGAFDWQLCVVINGQITLLHAMGFNDGSQLWIILARTQVAAAHVLDEMSLIQNEQTGMLRAALKFASQAGQATRDESQFEELTQLNNEMCRMQRELAQRNAELETLRKALEAKLKLEQAYNELSKSQERLEQMVEQRTAELQRVTEDSRHSRAQLMDAIESLDDGLVMYGPDERMVTCNTKYKEMYAACAHTMIPGTPYVDILRVFSQSGVPNLAGGSAEEWVARRLADFRNPGATREQRLADRWIRIGDYRTSDGGVVSLRTDITALKQAQEAAEAANCKLAALATTDGLTGIANRRRFQELLDAECVRARRYQLPLSLIMLDVDHFKNLNDSFGHQAGDEILKLMGKILASTARTTDLVARYGGEEFAVILVNTDHPAAAIAAERLRARIQAEAWPHRAVTASIGIGSFDADTADASALIDRADKALYFSKKNGRNRATSYLDVTSKHSFVQVAD